MVTNMLDENSRSRGEEVEGEGEGEGEGEVAVVLEIGGYQCILPRGSQWYFTKAKTSLRHWRRICCTVS